MKKILLFLLISSKLLAQYPTTSVGYISTAPLITDQYGQKFVPNTFIESKGIISTSGTQGATGLYVRANNSSSLADVGISLEVGTTANNAKFGILGNGIYNTAYTINGINLLYKNTGTGKPTGVVMGVEGVNPWGYDGVATTNSITGVAKAGDFYATTTSPVVGGQATAKGLESFGTAGIAYGVHAIAQGTSTSVGNAYGIYAKGTGALNNFAGYFEGNVTVTGTFSNPSDMKLKKNIIGIDNALEKILRLSPSNYEFNTDNYKEVNLSKGSHYGFIAQDIEKVFPELVSESSIVTSRSNNNRQTRNQLNSNITNEKEQEEVVLTENIKTVNYIEIIPILTKAIQEQQKQIEELKLEIQKLKGK